MQIQRYATVKGAERYRDELRAHFPLQTFIVALAPDSFADWSVATVNHIGRITSYAATRPRRFGQLAGQ